MEIDMMMEQPVQGTSLKNIPATHCGALDFSEPVFS